MLLNIHISLKVKYRPRILSRPMISDMMARQLWLCFTLRLGSVNTLLVVPVQSRGDAQKCRRIINGSRQSASLIRARAVGETKPDCRNMPIRDGRCAGMENDINVAASRQSSNGNSRLRPTIVMAFGIPAGFSIKAFTLLPSPIAVKYFNRHWRAVKSSMTHLAVINRPAKSWRKPKRRHHDAVAVIASRMNEAVL